MSRYLLKLAFLGTRYHGWQIQENAVTVQEMVEKALSELFSEKIVTHSCSRTDAGVHAREFYCHFDATYPFPVDRLPYALTTHLPPDIRPLDAFLVPDSFHARYSCRGKEYQYLIDNSVLGDPFLLDRAWHYPFALDAEELDKTAKIYLGTHDFSAFRAQGSNVKSTVRTMTRSDVARDGALIRFTVSGDGFLYNMVRIMQGTLIAHQRGKLDRSLEEIFESGDRTLAGFTVPPQGLTLMRVYYDDLSGSGKESGHG